MPLIARTIGESAVKLWGIDARTRLQRALSLIGMSIDDSNDPVIGDQHILLIHVGYLFEPRTLKSLSERSDCLLRCPATGEFAAAMASEDNYEALSALLLDPSQTPPSTVEVVEPVNLANFDVALRRAEPPLLLPVSSSNIDALEARLYGNAYKGITDLVTKWLWPRPAKQLVRLSTVMSLSPNMVTSLSFVLMLMATWLFYEGMYWSGLMAGWLMTLLDTVDGKLARVTVQSSRFGHYFDHLIDLFHPPFWYICWGLSLEDPRLLAFMSVDEAHWLIIYGYIGGRIVEGAFHLFAECSVFSWRPFDAWFRLITARRNPCLILLTLSLLISAPEWGLITITAWTVLTTAVLVVRLLQAAIGRWVSGKPMQSWLSQPDAETQHALSFRTFAQTRGAYAGS